MGHGLTGMVGQPDAGDRVPGVGDGDQGVFPDAIGDQPERKAGNHRETDEGEQAAVDLPTANRDRRGPTRRSLVHGPKPSGWVWAVAAHPNVPLAPGRPGSRRLRTPARTHGGPISK